MASIAAQAPARGVLTGGFSRRYTNGVKEFAIEASILRGGHQGDERAVPGLGEHLGEETTVAIDGELHEVVYSQPVRPGCEIFFKLAKDAGTRTE